MVFLFVFLNFHKICYPFTFLVRTTSQELAAMEKSELEQLW